VGNDMMTLKCHHVSVNQKSPGIAGAYLYVILAFFIF